RHRRRHHRRLPRPPHRPRHPRLAASNAVTLEAAAKTRPPRNPTAMPERPLWFGTNTPLSGAQEPEESGGHPIRRGGYGRWSRRGTLVLRDRAIPGRRVDGGLDRRRIGYGWRLCE